ncbi:DNA polymerase I [uncultured Eubacterium sp.]|uniref:DNA polymerase I n=1 Tax=uncultured Eubacterium sp. TaxID=165185 RepID=UPI0015BA0E9F|nr:DNA polymerase I [uncultured Eubacterium sp.]
MTLLVLDGNSIINRAFYGIKLLTTKQGDYTNAIYGFLNMMLKFEDMCKPDAVAVAFDMYAPTFRHKMYDEYKAGRHAMPDELRSQMPVLKNILHLLGIKTIECEGWEADDILGTLARVCRENGDACYIATGDRDSLQLAHDGVKVLLAKTKSTDVMDEQAILDEYGVEPHDLIQVKALQGDSSDNIPGVQGIGTKTALDLISRFKTVDYIYENIDTIDIKDGVRNKLKNNKDNAYLSLKLGEIVTDAPINTDINEYRLNDGDKKGASAEFARLELYSLMDRFNLNANDAITAVAEEEIPSREIERLTCVDADYLLEKIGDNDAYFYPEIIDNGITDMYFAFGDQIIVMPCETPEFKYFVRNFFENEKCRKYTYNSKYSHRLAKELGVECKNVCGDLMLSAYLLKPSDSNYSIDHLCLEYGVPVPEYKNSLGSTDERVVSVAVLKPLFEKTQVLLEEANQTDLLDNIELPLARVLAKMEIEGFAVDKKGIEDFGKKLGTRIDELTEMIYDLVGYEFNINSPKQLGVALFEDLGLPCKKKTKSGYSTNAEVLEGLRAESPVIDCILEYRSLTKLKSTYCEGLLKAIADDGRIHTSFNQVETRTGRISSLEPNLQNIPIRTELGREMRKFFIAGDGNMLVDADYSQIELRVLADLADDKNMIEAFNNGKDIHTSTAAQVFNMPEEFVTKQMRSSAKAVNFGIVYGIGAFSLAKDIGVSRKTAQEYIDSYLATYSGVDRYMTHVIELAREKGYSETLFNRRRYLPELNASNHMVRAAGERIARNMPIQGTAADIIKIAMVKVDRRLTEENMKSRLILQVHDELIVEAPEDEAEKALQIVTEEMENACKMKVKLRADGNIGKDWYSAH